MSLGKIGERQGSGPSDNREALSFKAQPGNWQVFVRTGRQGAGESGERRSRKGNQGIDTLSQRHQRIVVEF